MNLTNAFAQMDFPPVRTGLSEFSEMQWELIYRYPLVSLVVAYLFARLICVGADALLESGSGSDAAADAPKD